ncbi:FAD-binding oxidoreductase [Sphingomonas sp. BIUV-7]|uniref:FAD-binding oxidoreductase n=1 Tax=Sphingomonas natans TaxID=3063330 RepID=A0ABT8YDH6_9SPHN|nr:FAD-binding oxidoreductase [Sphingomonas sp. BIUV-7]MDO6416380.1 FAD-binding oxidoreductase [Sphingomonas sp. BIUV-7]
MRQTDIVVIGGGIAGLSAAMRFGKRARVVVIERESALGYHSSGRSATFCHYGIGDATVRGMTAASRPFFEAPPERFVEGALSLAKPALFIATAELLGELRALEGEMARFTDTITRVGPAEMRDIVPVLKTGADGIVEGLLDTSGRKLDSDLLLQAYARAVRAGGGEVVTDAGAIAVRRDGARWIVETAGESLSAGIVVNAGGAWADAIAIDAGVRPLGLQPMRRTIIGFDPPPGLDIAAWPFTKTAGDEGFYMLPDAGRLLASPMDVTPTEPTDAQPEDYDVALAAWRVEEATTLEVGRVKTKWAGLRTFTADKVPTAGFAPDAPGFFWLAGQGGYGLQTAPAMALAAEALLFGDAWPEQLAAFGVRPEQVMPDRLFA